RQAIAPPDDAEAFLREAVARISEANRDDAALVLIENGAVAGEHYSGSADTVDRDTVFPVASVSKWITAWGIMTLVEAGGLDLDRPAEDSLTRWKLPPSRFDHRGVTVRRLLSHTAGLTDGLGFGDYGP